MGRNLEKKRKEAKNRQKRQEAAEYYEATYESDRTPGKHDVHGIDAVNRILQGVGFPVEKRSLMEQIRGREQFDWVKGHNLVLGNILEHLPMERFASATDVTRAVSDYMLQTAGA